MDGRRLFALMVLTSTPALALATSPQEASLGTPVSESALSQYRGARDITFNMQDTNGQLYNNRATNTISGNNQVTDQAFSGANGIPTVIQNSGNNVLIQSATIVNVKLQ